MTRIVMIVTSINRLGKTHTPSGAWLEELAGPWNAFTDAGFAITLGSPMGGAAPIDPLSLEQPWFTLEGERFMADASAQQMLSQTLRIEEIHADESDALFLVGGAGAAWDYPESVHLARLVENFHASGRPVAAVCHGVLGFCEAVQPDGRRLVDGRCVTGVSNAEETLTGFDKIVPVMPENRLTELGGKYSCASPFDAHIEADGILFTGQNPASAKPLAQRIVDTLSPKVMGSAKAMGSA